VYILTSTNAVGRCDVIITEFRTLLVSNYCHYSVSLFGLLTSHQTLSCTAATVEELAGTATNVSLRRFVPVLSSFKSADASTKHHLCLIQRIGDQLNAA